MNVFVITDHNGDVLGVFTKQRRAKACLLNAQREWGETLNLTECEVNENGTQDTSRAEGDESTEGSAQESMEDQSTSAKDSVFTKD